MIIPQSPVPSTNTFRSCFKCIKLICLTICSIQPVGKNADIERDGALSALHLSVAIGFT